VSYLPGGAKFSRLCLYFSVTCETGASGGIAGNVALSKPAVLTYALPRTCRTCCARFLPTPHIYTRRAGGGDAARYPRRGGRVSLARTRTLRRLQRPNLNCRTIPTAHRTANIMPSLGTHAWTLNVCLRGAPASPDEYVILNDKRRTARSNDTGHKRGSGRVSASLTTQPSRSVAYRSRRAPFAAPAAAPSLAAFRVRIEWCARGICATRTLLRNINMADDISAASAATRNRGAADGWFHAHCLHLSYQRGCSAMHTSPLLATCGGVMAAGYRVWRHHQA